MLGFHFLTVLDVIATFQRKIHPKEKCEVITSILKKYLPIQIAPTDAHQKIMRGYYENKRFVSRRRHYQFSQDNKMIIIYDINQLRLFSFSKLRQNREARNAESLCLLKRNIPK